MGAMIESKLRFTQEQYRQALDVSLVGYLQEHGRQFIREGRRYRDTEHDSLVISEDNRWFWNSRGIWGNHAISYLRLAEGKTLPEAVFELCGYTPRLPPVPLPRLATTYHEFVLPPAASDYRRVFAYLNKSRGIDGEIIAAMMKQHRLYESAEYRNCVFVGMNEQNEPRYAALRGTSTIKAFKAEVGGSDKTCGFSMPGQNGCLCVYESSVDAMSHASLCKLSGGDWRKDHRLSLAGVWDGALERFLKSHEIRHITFCLDDDPAGNEASARYLQKYRTMGYNAHRLAPMAKDFNEELIFTLTKDIENDYEMEL